MNRRKFITNAGILTAGLVGYLQTGYPSIRKKRKVIIIGAGFAGLSAAYHLHRQDIDFEILECRKEVGGRVFSHTIDPAEKLVIELGAEWVGESHHLLRSLCDEFRIRLENNQFKTQAIYKGVYHKNYEDLLSPEWQQRYEALVDQYRKSDETTKEAMGRRLDHLDWWSYLANNGCKGQDLELRELLDSTDFGESIRHVSAYAALDEYARSSAHNEMDYKMEGGNQRLAFALKTLFTDKIKLGITVAKIEQGNGVKVTATNGYVTEGDKLICTLPATAVRKINWQPGLPTETSDALETLQYARINKHAVLFSQRFWGEEDFDLITDQPGHYFYHATKNQRSKKGALISYTIGDKAAVVANQSDDWCAAMISDSLQAGFPGTRSLMEKHTNYYWGNDERSMGAYAFYGKGQWFSLYPTLSKPHLHTLFAGEHLSENWQGFMEGALETGKLAAEKITGW